VLKYPASFDVRDFDNFSNKNWIEMAAIFFNAVVVVIVQYLLQSFANANVLLVLGELMGGDNDDGSVKRSAIPLIAGAIVLAQATMTVVTALADRMTQKGYGRKVLFIAGLVTLPIRCAATIYVRNSGDGFLLSTQIFDGIGAGLFNLMHPYIVADITWGSGRFNLVMGLTTSCFGLGATLSNFLGQLVVEKLGHVASLSGSLVISVIPIVIFVLFMPETKDLRLAKENKLENTTYELSYKNIT